MKAFDVRVVHEGLHLHRRVDRARQLGRVELQNSRDRQVAGTVELEIVGADNRAQEARIPVEHPELIPGRCGVDVRRQSALN